MSLTDVLGLFLHSSHNVSVINFCYFPWATCLMSVAQYTSGIFLFQDIPSCCTSYPQSLCNGSDFPISDFPSFLSFKMARFSPKDSSLVFMLVYIF